MLELTKETINLPLSCLQGGLKNIPLQPSPKTQKRARAMLNKAPIATMAPLVMRRSLLSRGVISAVALAAARPARQAAVPRAAPSQAVPRGLLCIARGSKVRECSLGAPRAWTGLGVGWAAMAGACARCFTSTGPLLAAASTGGRTPLHKAVEDGHAPSVKVLLEAVADKDEKDEKGLTPLAEAAGRGHAALVAMLLAAGADKEAKGPLGLTPLGLAGGKGHAAVVEVLLAAGADTGAKGQARQGGLTPLHVAPHPGGNPGANGWFI